MQKLKINMWAGILDIINCVLFAMSWFVIFGAAFSDAAAGTHATSGAGAFFYILAWAGVVLNIVALVQSRRHNISIVGSVLGIIGSALFGFTAILAFPAIVVLIIAAVFVMMQHPAKNGNNASVN
ncbi:hypothetical protein [Furfurilactobacillus rossiae]|uniref:Uncharacterized protein n=1 Tax=Furfurilactobacillus rossiae DSM 15814 TaxID=1114972 RepID=A0A0R1RFV1_9LACO|nr:hypothetical protein [Furfurilactobacillus rossiae]KRL53154.1 hypothetical protein FD35_GL001396 [Furfurilactobacillus rossiae DSM 15814]QFR66274.1 transporter [Furfurilactobacillus rossiae]QLE61719.1 Hypothetical protein LROSRS0_1673 [Furfurilactobacillus rossiae]